MSKWIEAFGVSALICFAAVYFFGFISVVVQCGEPMRCAAALGSML